MTHKLYNLNISVLVSCQTKTIYTKYLRFNKVRKAITITFLIFFMAIFSSCSMWNKVFPTKYGCKSNGKNVGAEKINSGEKVPKAKKFKA